MTSHSVTVTADDIARGVRGKSCECPVARAFLRTFRLGHVNVTQVCVWDMNSSRGWNLPREATNFIKRFDGGLKVEPITFTVDDSRIKV